MTESEAHAWSELFFKGVGWVPFDATEGAAEVPGSERGETTNRAWYQQGWVKIALDVAILIVLLGGAAYGYFAYKAATVGRTPTREDVGREYQRFTSVIQRSSGKRRLPWQTPDEYLEKAGGDLGPQRPLADRLNSKFVAALYSPSEIDAEVLRDLRAGTEGLRKELATNGKSKSKRLAGGVKR